LTLLAEGTGCGT